MRKYCDKFNIGVSPSGKASDSDSDIPVFESQYPSQNFIGDDLMKLGDIRLYNLKVIKNNETIFDDSSENLPEDLKHYDTKSTKFESGKLIIEV